MASSTHSPKTGVKLICLLVGIPASGKSTFIRSFRDYLDSTESNLNLMCVEFDSFLPRDTRYHTGDSSDVNFLWKKHRDILRENIDKFIGSPFGECPDREFSNALLSQIQTKCKDKDAILVLDDTFHHRSMRYQYYRLAREYRTGFLQLYFETSLEECLSRNKTREHPVPEQTIVNIKEQLSNPTTSLFKWEHDTITIDRTRDVKFDVIAAKMQVSSLNPAPPLVDSEKTLIRQEASRNETTTSMTHQCDITLRKIVGNLVKTASSSGLGKQELKLYADKCNTKRREVLNELSEENWEEGVKASDIEAIIDQMMKEAMLGTVM